MFILERLDGMKNIISQNRDEFGEELLSPTVRPYVGVGELLTHGNRTFCILRVCWCVLPSC